ncbi:MAG: D-alanine--D-alanine ligase family protein [Cyanobacteriota bacterium]|nr:D-alanine--D-alanine ligase family protein [Cyanobacteriota bacterium]
MSAASGSTRVGLVFGGASGEHDVSIRSAITVMGGLRAGANADRYDVRAFYIDREGRWWPPAVAESVLSGGTAPEATSSATANGRPGFQGFPEGALAVDVWFPVLHGPNGEDGTIQGLFTLMRRPYVGSGVLGSAVGMDKQAMKAAFSAAGLPQVPYLSLSRGDLERDGDGTPPEALLERIERTLGYPCFVKPANLGSSVGISKARDRASLVEGLRVASGLDPRLVVEQGVVARELECAVLGRPEALEASVLGEIRFDADWYDYAAKYSAGRSQTLIPAPVSAEVQERARAMAINACGAVGASGLARVDFFYSETDHALWLNEINTLPGFTSQSMYPMLWAASGLPLLDLLHRLLLDARESPRSQASSR